MANTDLSSVILGTYGVIKPPPPPPVEERWWWQRVHHRRPQTRKKVLVATINIKQTVAQRPRPALAHAGPP